MGGVGGSGSTSARAAWLVAARWLRRTLAAAPRLRRRRRPAAWLPGAGGEDTEVEAVEPGVGDTISSLVLVKPMEVVIERVALPPISSTLWKISNSPVNSSLILLQISELSGARIGTQFGCPLTTVVNCQVLYTDPPPQTGNGTPFPLSVVAVERFPWSLDAARVHVHTPGKVQSARQYWEGSISRASDEYPNSGRCSSEVCAKHW